VGGRRLDAEAFGTRGCVKGVCGEVADAILSLSDIEIDAVVEEFRGAERRWFVAGQGRSGLVGQMFAMRLAQLGRRVHVVGEVTATAIESNDGMLAISGSGETATTVMFAEVARANGARLVVLTGADGVLARLGDVVLRLPKRESVQFGGSLFEQLALVTLDSVIHCLEKVVGNAHDVMARRHMNLQ
jgi:6-phospho-3-hexuloisomerase